MSRSVRTATIVNRQGLHARPAAKFVDLAQRFACSIKVDKPGPGGAAGADKVDGKSVMEMVLLEAPQGTVLRIDAEGDDAEPAAEALVKLIQSGFGEE